MEVQPLKGYCIPNYPEKEHVLRNPNILNSLPKRWMGNIKVCAALSSALVFILAGCGQKTAGPDEQTGKTSSVETNGSAALMHETAKHEGSKMILDESKLVAPVFQHGEGRGSFGCVSVAPPAFLSEAEAFEIISEEALKEGISFEEGGLELKNVGIPTTSLFYNAEKENTEKVKLHNGTLKLDGYDKGGKIAFEFVSKDDVVEWKGSSEIWSSVEVYDVLKAAEGLKDGLNHKTAGNAVALFYDPMGFDEELFKRYNAEWSAVREDKRLTEDEKIAENTQIQNKYEEEIKEGRKAQLKEQVKDFLQWCKAQGVI